MKRARTEAQIQALITRIQDKLRGDTTDLYTWLQEGNKYGHLAGRSDNSIITEWNDLTDQAEGRQ